MARAKMQDKVTIYDVAAKANVSVSTVSRVLNNSPRVAERTRARVHTVIDELGYVPSRTARALAFSEIGSIRPSESEESRLDSIVRQKDQTESRLYFEGSWSVRERDAVKDAFLHDRVDVPWLCVKTHLHDTPTFVALQLEKPHRIAVAKAADDLVAQITSYEKDGPAEVAFG